MSKLCTIILDFDQGKEGGFLKVAVDSKGITFHQGKAIITVGKQEAQTIQRFLQDACSHIWRAPMVGGLLPALRSEREGDTLGETQSEPRTASEAQAECDS